ncbi:MAG: hypothetical protein ACLGG1_06105 [Gammaproteobacteria bacterium]
MNRYLDLLKRADQGSAGGGACVQERQMTNHQNLQNPVEGGFDGFVGRSDGTRAHSHPAASETQTDTAPPVRATRWLIHFLDREPMEVWFAPAADHAEALVGYPDAVAAEPLAEVRKTEVRKPVRTEHQVSSAVVAQSPAIGCSTCRHRKRPGRAEPGYCGGGRDDLPDAYGRHHPLRKLPDDDGATCANYISNEG